MRSRKLFPAVVAVLGWMHSGVSLQADEAGFKPIFNGESLAGWKGDDAFWRVEGNTIVGESTKDKPLDHNTFLLWDQGKIDDFTLRLDFKLVSTDPAAANSGVQFRSAIKPDGHVFGYQADIDLAGEYVGACYDELGRGMLATRGQVTVITPAGEKKSTDLGDPAELLKAYKPGDWNTYEITAQGSKITLSLNGHVTAEIDDQQVSDRDLSGVLALQLHSGPPQRVEFRNIRLKRLKLSDNRKKVVFFAGTPSHGPREHEHNAGCVLLGQKLDEAAAKGLPVLTEVYKNGWPADPTALDNADTVVFYCDGGEGHFLNSHREECDTFVNKGVGLVCLHYGVEVPKGPSGEKMLEWIGGYFEPFWSVNPHWTANFKNLPKHPITSGVAPFEINDEWYYHMRFRKDMEGVTPILVDLPPRESLSREDGPHSGNPAVREDVLVKKEPQTVAWAFDRPNNKGRGFGFTGGHFHRNWQNDNFRKIVLNAILWTAQGEVPANGVETSTPSDDDMKVNLDPKGQASKKLKETQVRLIADSKPKDAVKPLYTSPLVSTSTPGHAVDIDVDVTGAKSLYLVVTDGGNGFSADWADWVEPRLTGPSGEKKLTDLEWKSATSDWGHPGKNKNAEGAPLRVNGQSVAYGVGTHAVSVIQYELPEGFTRFKAKGALDNGGSDQGGSSVQFHVFTQAPPRSMLASAAGGGASHELADAVSQLNVHPELECRLFAGEPMMSNPANIEVDHLGRVWVCEVINYRHFRNTDVQERKEGDRILILEDTDRDGSADKSTTFYQGRDIDSAHGILVMPTPNGQGTKTLVSAGDSVMYLIDDNGDLKADRKEVLFTGISGVQHDHGIHAFVFGPDGKLYFNMGNEGRQIKDKDGKPIIDKAGNEVNDHGKPYQQGMVFRCNVDGSEFETLAWNFRNNWEVAVDSFGTMWQSDNDDDGNRGVRINYVMEYGNFGFHDELTGAAWTVPRTGWEEEIPQRHWHQNDPGVVPNMLVTGAGSPTGICVYEGTLLPEIFRGNLIHCDPGPNVVRAYTLKKEGAGYSAEIVNVIDGSRDQWFRPTDVCVCPDGSLMVADWYDPGVGGHRMEDIEHGRLFRVAPPGTPYSVPVFDLGNPNGAMAAVQSPNEAWRYLGWQALMGMGAGAEPVIAKLATSGSPRHRARALWLLGKLNIPADKKMAHLKLFLESGDTDLRVTAVRLVRQIIGQLDHDQLVAAIDMADPSPAVRRELAIGLREAKGVDISGPWAELASQYRTGDRWQLEALGISANARWEACLGAWLQEVGDKWNNASGRDIVWRSRAPQTPKLLAEIISNEKTPADQLPRYFRAFDFLPKQDVEPVVAQLALNEAKGDAARKSLIATEALARVPAADVTGKPEFKAAMDRVLASTAGTGQYLAVVDKFNLADQYEKVLRMAQDDPETQLAAEAVRLLLSKGQGDLLARALRGDDAALATATSKALAAAADQRSQPILMAVIGEKDLSLERRREAIKAVGSFHAGGKTLEGMARKSEYDPALKDAIAVALHNAPWPDVKNSANELFPLPPGKDSKPLPPITELANRRGDAVAGRILFHTTETCRVCHIVNGLGKEVGPNLSEIGKKLSRQAMYESILFPSAGISHNYESWTIATTDGEVLVGLITSETPEELTIKDAKGLVRTVKTSQIEARKKSEVSLMPADLQKVLSEQELVDIVEYLQTLKDAQPVAAGK